MTDTRKILEMLHAHQVTVDQASDLLAALEAPQGEAPKASAARMIRIIVEAEDEAIVRVNVPATLAKFALQMIPKDVRGELQAQGIDLSEFLTTLQGDLPEGRLVDVEAEE
nr:hypothetical protein [Deinococcota bacterium]